MMQAQAPARQASQASTSALERLEKARQALKEGCWHLTYSKHKNACQAAKSLGGVVVFHGGKWAVVF